MKKRFIFLTLIGLLFIIPNVKAEVTGSITLDELKNNGNDVTETYSTDDGILTYYLENSTSFSLKLLGNDLEPNPSDSSMIRISVITPGGSMTSTAGFSIINQMGYAINHTDSQYSYNSYFPYFTLSISHSADNSAIKITKGSTEYDAIRIYFVNPTIFDEFDEVFNNLVTNNTLEIDSVKPDDILTNDAMITTALNKFNTKDYSFEGACDDEEMENCFLTIRSNSNGRIAVRYPVTYVFQNEDQTIANKISVFSDNFEEYAQDNFGPMGVIFTIEDLENLNYLYTYIKNPTSETNKINAAAKFSSQIQKILNYSNVQAEFYIGNGFGNFGDLVSMAMGHIAISYDEVIYGAANGVGYLRINNLYIPDDTDGSREAVIAAAKARIEAYLPDATVSIVYKDDISNITNPDVLYNIDTTNTNGEYYTVTIDDNAYDFIFTKDSSKMQETKVNTVDFDTNIKVNTNNTNIPLDTKVKVNVLDKNSDNYINLMRKLKINDGYAVDLSLFSTTANAYYTTLENGNFKVYLPIPDGYDTKDLVVYFLNDDNSIDEFEVSYEGNFAVFETPHFSTYTLTSSGDTNPNTGDNILTYLIIFTITSTGLIILKKKKEA